MDKAVHVVYDSSNYSRFKKEQSLNRNYNDNTYGGKQYGQEVSARPVWDVSVDGGVKMDSARLVKELSVDVGLGNNTMTYSKHTSCEK